METFDTGIYGLNIARAQNKMRLRRSLAPFTGTLIHESRRVGNSFNPGGYLNDRYSLWLWHRSLLPFIQMHGIASIGRRSAVEYYAAKALLVRDLCEGKLCRIEIFTPTMDFIITSSPPGTDESNFKYRSQLIDAKSRKIVWESTRLRSACYIQSYLITQIINRI